MGLAPTPTASCFCNKSYCSTARETRFLIFQESNSDKEAPVRGRRLLKLSPFSSHTYSPSSLRGWWAARKRDISDPGCRRISEPWGNNRERKLQSSLHGRKTQPWAFQQVLFLLLGRPSTPSCGRPDLLKFGPSQHLNLFPCSHLGGNRRANTRPAIHQVLQSSNAILPNDVFFFIMRSFHTFTSPSKRSEWQPVVKDFISSSLYQTRRSSRLDSKATQ